MNTRIAWIAILSCLVLSCKHDVGSPSPDPAAGGGSGGGSGGDSTPCDPNKIYFQQQVLPILLSNCAMSGCHDVTSHSNGIILTSYDKVMSTGDVVPGRPGDSGLYEAIMETDPDKRMPRPPMSPLTNTQKELIRQWILQGAQNLVCQSTTCDSTNITYSITIRNIISNKCQGCHSGTGASGGIDLSTYNGLKARVTDGRLWGSVNQSPGFAPMPMGGAKLSECELTQIRKWIDAGALNN